MVLCCPHGGVHATNGCTQLGWGTTRVVVLHVIVRIKSPTITATVIVGGWVSCLTKPIHQGPSLRRPLACSPTFPVGKYSSSCVSSQLSSRKNTAAVGAVLNASAVQLNQLFRTVGDLWNATPQEGQPRFSAVFVTRMESQVLAAEDALNQHPNQPTAPCSVVRANSQRDLRKCARK